MFQLLKLVLSALQPFLVPICFVAAWGLAIAFVWSAIASTRDVLARSKQMHAIPCSHCQFSTNDHRLKCTVQPSLANTEQAVNCLDYCPRQDVYSRSARQ